MIVMGIDEVGRGCWAGPLVVGAVILSEPLEGLTDSKLLNSTKREVLAALIHEQALCGIGWVSPSEIDELGLTAATTLAMERAIADMPDEYDEIIIDGSVQYLPAHPKAKTLIKADLTVPAVSAASIIAKVARDEYMREAAARYPQYGFERHVGYGTALHSTRLKAHGVSDLHRRSFKPVRVLVQ
jgi:ribonuclease HII